MFTYIIKDHGLRWEQTVVALNQIQQSDNIWGCMGFVALGGLSDHNVVVSRAGTDRCELEDYW